MGTSEQAHVIVGMCAYVGMHVPGGLGSGQGWPRVTGPKEHVVRGWVAIPPPPG